MSFSYKLKSHPKKLLKNHLENVGNLSENIVISKSIRNRDFFSKIAFLIGISHDFGKTTSFFQKMLKEDERTKYANHGFLSALFGYYVLKSYLYQTKGLDKFWYMPIIAWVIINKHHGNIQNVGGVDGELGKLDDEGKIEDCVKQVKDIARNNLEEVKLIYNKLFKNTLNLQKFLDIFCKPKKTANFIKEIRKDIIRISREEDIEYYFLILFFYSVLLDADKMEASNTEIPQRIDISPNLVERYKEIKFGTGRMDINKVRERAYKEINDSVFELNIKNDRILSINLPTGIGKTLSGLSFALKLKTRIKSELEFSPRIIYCLPFLSIIDQNADVLEDMFRSASGYKEIPSNLFLKHHHLAEIEYREEKENEINPIKDINKSLLLTEGWYAEIIITTFIQFFYSLITNRNRSARKFHNIVNSIIILDEIQAIPIKYWLLMNKTLSYLSKEFNCWIILMTATEPLIFEEDTEIKSLVKNKTKYFKLFNRYKFNFDFIEKTLDEFSDEFFNFLLKEKSKDIMVVLNTVGACKKLYNDLKDKLKQYYKIKADQTIDKYGICIFSDIELINLSSCILPEFRLNRIKRIKENNKRKVIITTQLIEAGVDISVDIIYRDLAPIDSLIQTAGRCNRNNREAGIVHIIILKEDKTQRRYCSWIYDAVLLDIAEEIINGKQKIAESDFIVNAQKKYYNLVKERKSEQESQNILTHLETLNFGEIFEFRLIEEKMNHISIFIELNREAEKIRNKIEKILLERDRLIRRENLLIIKNAMNKYVISAKFSPKDNLVLSLPTINDLEDFRYVPKENVEKWYKLDTGFEVAKDDTESRII